MNVSEFPMFRVRLPPALAARLRERAANNRRSTSREMEVCLEAVLDQKSAESRPETGGQPAAGEASQA